MRLFLAAVMLFSAMASAQTPPAKTPAAGTAEAVNNEDALRRELNNLRAEINALTQRVEALTRALAVLSSQAVIDVPIRTMTDYFAGPESGSQPQVIASYTGRLVSASVMLVHTERYGGTEYHGNGRSVVVTPGGSAAIPVDGAGAPCNWIVYDERNAIKVRSESCSYLSPGLRGLFTGAVFYKN
jgi:hypothetical protein